MLVGKQTRRILRFLAGIILLALIAGAVLPLWFPWILRPIAKRFGATYTRYERDGYGRFQLHHVSFTNDAGHFEAEKIQVLNPAEWIWKCFLDPHSESFVEAASWKYIVNERGTKPRA